jgi:dipeptidyl aminopeptidase/acylaminoacyl peptidase
MRRALLGLLLLPAAAAAETREVGSLVLDGVPDIPPSVRERIEQYANTRQALWADWDLSGKGMLILTRFGETLQVHHVAAPGAARRQLTFAAEQVSGAAYDPARPGGFYLRMDVGGGEFYQYFWHDLATGKRTLVTDGKSRNESLVVSRRGGQIAYVSTRRNGKDFDLWLAGADPASARLAKELEGQWAVHEFSDDDRRLLLSRQVSANEMHLFVFEIASGALTEIDPTGDEKVAYVPGGFSRGGRGVYFASDEGSEHLRLHHLDLASGKKELLTPDLGWSVASVAVSPDGKWLAYDVNEGGVSVVYVAPTARPRAAARLPLPRGVGGGRPRFDRASRRVAFTLSTSNSSYDVHVVDLATRRVERWTESELGGIPPERFVEATLVEFPSFDGRKIPAFVYRPRAPRGKVPVLIDIHGGPEAQHRPAFSSTTQYWVNELGVAVIAPNVRGSAGYGKSYLLLDNGLRREDAVKDIGALLDWIATQPDLDPARVAVYGGSYGGYMVLASLIHFPGRLRAGVDVVGISSFVTLLESTQEYRRDLRRPEYGDERDPAMRAHLQKISPLTSAAKIRSPLLVVQGRNDPRVPISESDQIVKAVRAGKVPVWYVVANDEGHGFRRKANRDYYLAVMSRFLEEHLLR